MKSIKHIATAFVLVCALSANAQQLPLVSQYFYTPMLYNPSMTGNGEEVKIWAMDREQWVKMPGAPSTRGGTVEAGLWKNRLGVGLNVFHDKTDIISRLIVEPSFAGRVPLFKDAYLGLGFSVGVMSARIDFDHANAEVPTDPHLYQSLRNKATVDMNAGINFQWRTLFVGFAVPQVLGNRAKYSEALNEAQYNLSRHYLVHASYKLELLKKKFSIHPMFLVKINQPAPVQYEGSLVLGFKDWVWAGAGYRSGNGIMAMAGFQLFRTVTIGYCYDHYLNKDYTKQVGSTHEVVVGVRIPYAQSQKKEIEELKKKLAANDSVDAKQQALIDSLQNQADSTAAKTKDLDDKTKKLKEKTDALEQGMDEYKKKVDQQGGLIEDFSKAMNDMQTRQKTEAAFTGQQGPGSNLYRLDNVYFETNSSYLMKESNVQLDRIVKYMSENPGDKLKIYGHTDLVASDEYNLWLSERRAKAVYEYLVNHGVSNDRLSYVGFGKKMPVADNATDEGRAQNRRVEVEVVK